MGCCQNLDLRAPCLLQMKFFLSTGLIYLVLQNLDSVTSSCCSIGAMHSGKEWHSALWLNAVHSAKKWWIQEFVLLLYNIFFLNPDYVAARSQWCDEIHEFMYLNWDWNNFSLNDPRSYECYLSSSNAVAVLYQSSYQANWELVITLVDISSGFESSSRPSPATS